ncbi:hypothetical protein PS3A_44320 [Pseudomonas sp. 3A(2025)]
MNVGDFFESAGWLAIIDFRLFLWPVNYSENDEVGSRVEISSPELIFAVIDKILPLGGGRSFVFHKSEALGFIIQLSPVKIKLTALSVEERGHGFFCVDVSDVSIESCRLRYQELLKSKNIKSGDWLDYV